MDNLIRRHQRDEVRELRALERTGTDPVAGSFTDRADARLAADAASRAVAAAIAALDPGQRDALLLVTWADLICQLLLRIDRSVPVAHSELETKPAQRFDLGGRSWCRQNLG